MRKAFTLIELVVSLAILAVVLSFAGVIFKVSIGSHRLALANAEIMQKLRTIAEQLDADFRGLRKDADILVIWSAARNLNYVDPDPSNPNPNHPAAFERFDRIMFFTTGDFQTYAGNPVVRGNIARVCYTLARGPSADPADPNWPREQKPPKRILARTQHILVAPANPSEQLDTSQFTDSQWLAWNSEQESDKITLAGWRQLPIADKVNMLSVIGDVTVQGPPDSTTKEAARGVLIDRAQPASIHALFCEGVGQFTVQGWSDLQGRWIPEVNPNGDKSLDDSDFILQGADLHPTRNPGVWYPWGGVTLRGIQYDSQNIDEADFNGIPGLGRALKFTFKLYDSRGLIKNGRTFTHIVSLDD